ncbi:TonB-dependent receptor [Thermococcus sp. MAR1]|nr:TonB-dependent receptor [Thermococcus sp. MAR1]NJE11193.1 TonB-dependent receptor [Thermococcus sp. MAR1]
MGHTVYYSIRIEQWEEFKSFIERICRGIGYDFVDNGDSILIIPECHNVEPLEIRMEGAGFVKTNLIEPCHSVYLLVLHSASSFGSVGVWED